MNLTVRKYAFTILLLTGCFFLSSCSENDPQPEPTLANHISGSWTAESVELDDSQLQEWSDFVLTIYVKADTSGWFYAENVPSYDQLEPEEREKWLNVWPDTSRWSFENHYIMVRNDGVEIALDTSGTDRMYLSMILPGWEYDCEPSEGQGCILPFLGDWRFELVREN